MENIRKSFIVAESSLGFKYHLSSRDFKTIRVENIFPRINSFLSIKIIL